MDEKHSLALWLLAIHGASSVLSIPNRIRLLPYSTSPVFLGYAQIGLGVVFAVVSLVMIILFYRKQKKAAYLIGLVYAGALTLGAAVRLVMAIVISPVFLVIFGYLISILVFGTITLVLWNKYGYLSS